MALQVKYPEGQSDALYQLLASYCGSAMQASADASLTDVQVSSKSMGKPWKTVKGRDSVLRTLAESSKKGRELLTAGDANNAEVEKWLQCAAAEADSQLKLHQLESELLTRTFLVGETLSLADLAVFAAISPELLALPSPARDPLSSVLRWYDHVYHSSVSSASRGSRVAEIFPAVKLHKKPFRMPPPPPTTSKAAKGQHAAKDTTPSPLPAATTPATNAAVTASSNARQGPSASETAESNTGSPPQSAASASASAAPPGVDPEVAARNAAKRKEKAEKKAKKEKPPPPPAKEAASISALNIRVGRVVSAENHLEADKLYVEKIDLGEAEPRTVVSGLRPFVPLDQMQDRMVVVLTNLKPAKMVGIQSAGMVLCASNQDHTQVDPLRPPDGAVVGERITFEGHAGEPESQLNPKKKVFEELAPSLTTDATGQARFANIPFMTSAGPVVSAVANAVVK